MSLLIPVSSKYYQKRFQLKSENFSIGLRWYLVSTKVVSPLTVTGTLFSVSASNAKKFILATYGASIVVFHIEIIRASCTLCQICVARFALSNTDRGEIISALSRSFYKNTTLVSKLLAKDRCSIVIVPKWISADTPKSTVTFDLQEDLWNLPKSPVDYVCKKGNISICAGWNVNCYE